MATFDRSGSFHGRLSDRGILHRLRFDLGWTFGKTAMYVAGWKADLDGDRETALGALDGAHGRFQVFSE